MCQHAWALEKVCRVCSVKDWELATPIKSQPRDCRCRTCCCYIRSDWKPWKGKVSTATSLEVHDVTLSMITVYKELHEKSQAEQDAMTQESFVFVSVFV